MKNVILVSKQICNKLKPFTLSSTLNRFYSTGVRNATVTAHRARLFEEEKQRQVYFFVLFCLFKIINNPTNLLFYVIKLKEIERIEKIEVKVIDPSTEETILMMNKDLSTPYNCAMRNITFI